MATVVEQRLIFCPHEQKKTIHHRNVERLNWILHIILSVLTLGLWLMVVIFLVIANLFVTHDGWSCSQCGRPYP